MKYIKYFEYKKQYREVDISKLWEFINDIDNMRMYYSEFGYIVDVDSPKVFFQEVLKSMLTDKEIEFNRVVNPIDSEVSYSFCGRVKDVFIWLGELHVQLYEDSSNIYNLGKISAGQMKETIVRIYNSEITKLEQNIEFIKMKIDAKKYNL